ncbi:MAG: hypothetical protein JKY08_03900 [Flavobacteriaceae bacterium]|nr:hypothetical protein [Flavobacteriaceae bacterium]
MSFIFKEYPEEKLIVKKIRGNISLLEIQDVLIKTIQINAQFPEHKILNDYRFSTFDFNVPELKAMLKGIKLKELPQQWKVFIFDSEEKNPLYNLYLKTYNFKNTRVFDSLETACNFLNLDHCLVADFLTTSTEY